MPFRRYLRHRRPFEVHEGFILEPFDDHNDMIPSPFDQNERW